MRSPILFLMRPIPGSALARQAPRPAYGVLGHGAWIRAGMLPLGHWQPALERAFGEIAAAARQAAAAG